MMNKQIHFACAAIFLTATMAAENQGPLAELDAKIQENLASDKWNDASKDYVGALWKDYREAHVNPQKETSIRSISGRMPDAQKYEDYLGAYGRGADPGRPFLEVVKDEGGGFHVKLEGHIIPAVLANKTLLFTTGDIVHSPLPPMSKKPYCTLEMFMIIRTDGEFFFGSPEVPPDKWMPLSKNKNPVTK